MAAAGRYSSLLSDSLGGLLGGSLGSLRRRRGSRTLAALALGGARGHTYRRIHGKHQPCYPIILIGLGGSTILDSDSEVIVSGGQ